MLDRTIRHQQPILEVKIPPLKPGAIEYLCMEIPLLRMSLSNYLPEPGWNRPVKSVYPKGLRGPIHFIGNGVPAEAARVTRRLGLIQVGLAAPQGLLGAPALAVFLLQIRIEVGILERDRGLGGDQLQHRAPGRREDPGSQIILEVEHSDQCGLLDQRQAENGTDAITSGIPARGQDTWHTRVGPKHPL